MHYIKQFHKNSKIFQWKRKEKHKKDFLFKSQAPRDHGNEVNGTSGQVGIECITKVRFKA